MTPAPVPPDGETRRWTIYVCPVCADFDCSANVTCDGYTDAHPDAHDVSPMVPVEVVAAGRAAATPDPPDDEGWSPGVDDPEPPALGDIDTGEGWYQT